MQKVQPRSWSQKRCLIFCKCLLCIQQANDGKEEALQLFPRSKASDPPRAQGCQFYFVTSNGLQSWTCQHCMFNHFLFSIRNSRYFPTWKLFELSRTYLLKGHR